MRTATLLEKTRHRTVVVIPVYLPPGSDRALGARLLRDNVELCLSQIARPEHVCLSVDGARFGEDVAAEYGRELGVRVVVGRDNGGKLVALRRGVGAMIECPGVEYVAAVDADGDHFGNELPNLVRAAEHARACAGAAEVMVLGQRTSPHRPLGFLRGELEELADRVLMDALAFDAARCGVPLRLECAMAPHGVVDFHSGYKLFSCGAARAVFASEPRPCGFETAYYRHAIEAVMTVEALKSGARLVLVNRSTFNEQPMSTFGRMDRAQLMADTMIWPCRRLDIPVRFVDQWLRNHLPALLLTTLAPQGKDELLAVRRLVLEALGGEPGDDAEVLWGPLFV
ncbi:MAG: hypothetical protein H6982_05755 [Chromatiales bacterium]|nr:hypothetical protein [Chromatiales bacterium]